VREEDKTTLHDTPRQEDNKQYQQHTTQHSAMLNNTTHTTIHTGFEEWLSALKAEHDNLNFFEQNLQVWRQLWRVCERSQVLNV
jgi:hypothetical protein